MPARLTALILILSLCIALPMCWCCMAVAAPESETASCCAHKHHAAAGHQHGHSTDQSCPCARHEASRDVASTFVKAPAPVLKLLTEPLWLLSSAANLHLQLSPVSAPRHDHGPPLHASPPLYARHCALLI